MLETTGMVPDVCAYSVWSFCLPGQKWPYPSKAYYACYITFIIRQARKQTWLQVIGRHKRKDIKKDPKNKCWNVSALNKGNIILYSQLSFILHVQIFVFWGILLFCSHLSRVGSDIIFWFRWMGLGWRDNGFSFNSRLTWILITISTAGSIHLTQCLCSKLAQKSHEGRTHEGIRGWERQSWFGWIALMCLSAFWGMWGPLYPELSSSQSTKMKN